jgi:antitoxin ParD1/3/4
MPPSLSPLTADQTMRIEALVAQGQFDTPSAVVQEGLRLVEEQVADDAAKLAALRLAVQEGLDDLENGRFIDCRSREELAALMDRLWREAQEGFVRQNEAEEL